MSDRQKVRPRGIHGGHPGVKAELFMMRKGSDEGLAITTCRSRRATGSRFLLRLAEDGDHPTSAILTVEEDLLDGFITPEQALTAYGLKRQSAPVAFPSSDPKQRPS